MKYMIYLMNVLIRKIKKNIASESFLNHYRNSIDMDKPTLCLTHDIDEAYEGNLDKIVDIEKEYGVNSTMFLFGPSLPSKKWVKKNRYIDFQFHANFVSRNRKTFLIEKRDIENLIGNKTTITRSHFYLMPDIGLVSKHFKADSTYNNWTNLAQFKAFSLKDSLIEFPMFPEIKFIDECKDYITMKKLWKDIFSIARKTNGLIVTNTHPTQFPSYGKKMQEFFMTQKGFEIMTLSGLLKGIEKQKR